MASVRPFRALRPRPELASQICELPYDVVSTQEARELAKGNPRSFFHVSRPEIDLEPGIDPHDDRVYAAGRKNLQSLIDAGDLARDESAHLYLYRQVMGEHRQDGLVALASCREYEENVVRKHERTRPSKENDRVRHIETLNAQTGPVFLTYRPVPEITRQLAGVAERGPTYDFTAADGVRHMAWLISDRAEIASLQQAFERVECLYIADGHHRSAAAARVCRQRNGSGESDSFLSVIFPADHVQILPYNRVVKDLNGKTPEAFLREIGSVCEWNRTKGPVAPQARHRFGLYLAGDWYDLAMRPEEEVERDPVGRLDVSLLQDRILGPILGIDDPRTDSRVDFVGGIRGSSELQARVDSGEYACAFSMYRTSLEELMRVADAEALMPPKSTWFEPKLRDALFSHLMG